MSSFSSSHSVVKLLLICLCSIFLPLCFQILSLRPIQRVMIAILWSRLLATIFQYPEVLLPAAELTLLLVYLCGFVCSSRVSFWVPSQRIYLGSRLVQNIQSIWLCIRLPGFRLLLLRCLFFLNFWMSSSHCSAFKVSKRPRSPNDDFVTTERAFSQMPTLPGVNAVCHTSLVVDSFLHPVPRW